MILCWIGWLQARGSADYTIVKRVDMLRIFFNHYKAGWPLMEKDMPTYVESPVQPYSDAQLNAMLDVGDEDERDVVMFHYGSGGRKAEAQHGGWTDINWERSIFRVAVKKEKKRNKGRPPDSNQKTERREKSRWTKS